MKNIFVSLALLGMLVSLIVSYRAEKRLEQTERKLTSLVGFVEGMAPNASFRYVDGHWVLHLPRKLKGDRNE